MLDQTEAQVGRQVGNSPLIGGDERLHIGIVANHGGDVIMIAGIASAIIAEQFSLQTRPSVPIFLELLNLVLRNATKHRSVHIPRFRILG